ncbi:MAG: hypothetical protein P9L92_16670 [Candidatus Electryonea clarkiae]|nr:hypothetical protein [Candidatus Electryonea clarkiae]
MQDIDKTQYVPYRQDGEPPRKAALIKVDFNIEGLTDTDVQVLGHLTEAADMMNAIFRNQFEPKTVVIRRLVHQLAAVADGDTKEKLTYYSTMIDLQNSPYALLPRKNAILEIPLDELHKLAEKAGGLAPRDLAEVGVLMTMNFPTPDFANFYPNDMTDEEFEDLGESANVVNSIVMRDYDGEPDILLNEERYAEALLPVIAHLKEVRKLVKDPGFQLYLDAKIIELEIGSEESRRIADYTWVRHDNPIDIVISTAVEVYLDNYKNARGAALGGVFVRNMEAEELLNALVERVPAWEYNAPWQNKKTDIDPETMPKLKFVDVLTWAGDFVTGPFTTIAQSLPNDEWVMQNVGTVNMVYMNTGKAVHKVSGNLAAETFLTKAEFENVKDMLFDANQLHSALHEIGHTTGRMDEKHQGQPRDYFEEEYSFLEETRAELFGMWSLNLLVEDGIVDDRKRRACYDGMLISMLTSLKFDPVQAHNKARNGMFHYFVDKEAVTTVEEEGETRWQFDFEKAPDVVAEMLKLIGDIKASGDKEAAVKLREKYVFPDDLKAEIERRTADFPLGRGLIFPRLKKEGNRYLPELEYPDSFSGQPKFNMDLM